MDIAGFKGFNGYDPRPGSMSDSLMQQQLASRRQAQALLGQPSMLGYQRPMGAYQSSAPQTHYTPQNSHAYSSSLQNQFAMKFLFSMMQAMMSVNQGFGSFLGAR